METKLELRGVTKHFGDTAAVKGLDLALRKGEFLSLLGPSGCGKSTTLSMIAGFFPPDKGEILVDGQIVNKMPPRKRRISSSSCCRSPSAPRCLADRSRDPDSDLRVMRAEQGGSAARGVK